MRNPLFIFLFLIIISQSLSMNCSDVPTQTKCLQLNGCTWVSPSCTGIFAPTCIPPSCYYVDSLSSNYTTEDGTPSNPCKSISLAINKLANTTGTIIVMNYVDNVTAELTQVHIFSGGITTIKSLFSDSLYNLDFTKAILSSTSGITLFLRVNALGTLVVMNGIISNTFTTNQYAFDIYGNVTFENVHIVNTTSTSATIVRTQTVNSTFIYNGGSNSNMALTYTLSYGTIVFKNIIFNAIGSVSTFITIGGVTNTPTIAVFDGLQVRGGLNAIGCPFIYAYAYSDVTVQNTILEQTSMALLYSNQAQNILITNVTCQNMTPYKPTLIYLQDYVGGVNTIENCTFNNITVSSSLILVEKNGIILNLNRVQMANITKSTVIKENQQYAAEWAGGLCMLTRNDAIISINNSNFTNIDSHCLGIKESALTLANSNFNNSALPQSTAITEDTIDSLNDKSGRTWLIIEGSTTIIPTAYQFVLIGNRFIKNNAISKYGGAIRLIGTILSQIYATGNEFIGNTAYYGGAIYCGNNLMSFIFSNNIFAENSAYDGGVIYKRSVEFNNKPYPPSVVLNGEHFSKNTAVRNGGALLLDWESLCMQGTVFTDNTAQNGGAIYFINLDKYFNDQYGCFKDNTFSQNSATEVGGAMKLFFSFDSFNDDATTTFINNTAYKGADVSSEKPSYYIFSFYDVLVEKTFDAYDDLSEWVTNTTRTSLAFSLNTSESIGDAKILQKSGQEISQILMIEIMNENKELLDYIRTEQISVDIDGYVNIVNSFVPFVPAAPLLFTFDKGRIYIKYVLTIVGEPNTTANLIFTGLKSSSNLLMDANLLMDFIIPVYFQDCDIGEMFNTESRTCDLCTEGTYSLSNPYSGSSKCLKCDENADCLGGTKIAVLPGYWRFDAQSVNILQCPANNACLGGLVDEKYIEQGKCGAEYQGNLCNKCIPNYAKFGSSEECLDCKRDEFYYIKLFGFFALKIAVVLYSVKVNLNKINLSKKVYNSTNVKLTKRLINNDFQSNLIKIVVNFVQISTLIIQYKAQWPDFILDVLNVTNKFIPTDTDSFSIDCFLALILQNTQYIFFIKLVITLIQPFGIWILLVIGYILILLIKTEKLRENPKISKNITVLFIITAFIIQPSLIQATLEVFRCQNLQDYTHPVYYMTKDTDIECWTRLHIVWSLGIALPFFLLWGIVLPLLLLRKLRSTEKNLQDPEVYSRFAFVYEGLKRNRYYWEFINLLRKTVLIIIFVFLNVISIQAQAFTTFLVLFFAGFFHVRCSPYQDQRLNRLELFSLVTLGIMAYSGMFFLSGGSSNLATIVLIIFAVICNVLFYLTTLVYFIKSYRDTAKRIVRNVSFKISRTLSRDKSRKSYNSDSSISIDKKDKSRPDTHNIAHLFSSVNLYLDQDVTEPAIPKNFTEPSLIPDEDEDTERGNNKKMVYLDSKVLNDSIVKGLGNTDYNGLRQASDLSHLDSQPALLHPHERRSITSAQRQSSPARKPGPLLIPMRMFSTQEDDTLKGSPHKFGPQMFPSPSIDLSSPLGVQRRFNFVNAEKLLTTLNTGETQENVETLPPPSSQRRLKSEYEDYQMLMTPRSNMMTDVQLMQRTSQTEPIIAKDPEEEDDEQ